MKTLTQTLKKEVKRQLALKSEETYIGYPYVVMNGKKILAALNEAEARGRAAGLEEAAQYCETARTITCDSLSARITEEMRGSDCAVGIRGLQYLGPLGKGHAE